MTLEILEKRPEFQTDPAFYADYGDAQIVARAFEDYSIVRAGVMQIDFDSGDGWKRLYTTGDLYDNSIDSDEALGSLESDGKLRWENNPWFEVWTENEDGDTECVTDEVFFSIAEAYEWVEARLHDLQSHPTYDKFAWEKEGAKKQLQKSENHLVALRTQTLSYVHPQTTSISEADFWKGWSKGVQDSIETIGKNPL